MINEYKQCIIVRMDLKLSSGKLAAQVAHASVTSLDFANTRDIVNWKNSGQKKVVLKIETLNDILKLKEQVKIKKLPFALIIDAGKTEIEPGTITALGIGPVISEKIDILTSKLKML